MRRPALRIQLDQLEGLTFHEREATKMNNKIPTVQDVFVSKMANSCAINQQRNSYSPNDDWGVQAGAVARVAALQRRSPVVAGQSEFVCENAAKLEGTSLSEARSSW